MKNWQKRLLCIFTALVIAVPLLNIGIRAEAGTREANDSGWEILLNESFENPLPYWPWMPEDWETTSQDQAWQWTIADGYEYNVGTHSGSKIALCMHEPEDEEEFFGGMPPALTTPAVDLSDKAEGKLSFWVLMVDNDGEDDIRVYYRKPVPNYGYLYDLVQLYYDEDNKQSEENGYSNYVIDLPQDALRKDTSFSFEGSYSYNYGIVNGLDDVMVMAKSQPEFTSHSLVLSGKIGVNFFVTLPGDVRDYEGSYVTFTCNGVESDPVFLDQGFTNASGESYGFTCYVNSLQMAEDIIAVFHYGEDHTKTVEDSYSVLKYVKYIVDNPSMFTDKVVSLAKAINDYGYYAQQFLSRTHNFDLGESGAYAEVGTVYHELGSADLTDPAMLAELQEYACTYEATGTHPIKGLSYSLALDSDTEIRIYVRLQEGTAADYGIASENGETVQETTALSDPGADGRYKISIGNIPAHKLGDAYRVTVGNVDGEGVIKVSALSYPYTVLSNSSQPDDAKKAMCAFYNYYKCAMAYSGQN